jgi:hypothetical protein
MTHLKRNGVDTQTSVSDEATKNKDGVVTGNRGRAKRKVKYEEVRETEVPREVQEKFLKEGWSLRFIRYYINGEPDYRYLNRREREGFEFVQLDELPEWYRDAFTVEDDRKRTGLLLSGDVVLAKAPVELIEDRRRYINNKTTAIVNAVDVNVLQRKGFVDLGSRSTINNREPEFGS